MRQPGVSLPGLLPTEPGLVSAALRMVPGAAAGCRVLASLFMAAVVVTPVSRDCCVSCSGVLVTRSAAPVVLSGLLGACSLLLVSIELKKIILKPTL